MLTSRVSIGSEDISWGSRKNPFIEIPFPDDWHWIFLPSCSVSVKAVYSSFAIWNRAHGHLLISLHPTCFCVQPRLNAERSQYKWRFQSIYLSVQPRLNARDRCKSDFILSVDIFREARRGLSDKYLLRSQRVSPIIYWAKIIQYNPHSISTKPFLSPLIFYWALKRVQQKLTGDCIEWLYPYIVAIGVYDKRSPSLAMNDSKTCRSPHKGT